MTATNLGGLTSVQFAGTAGGALIAQMDTQVTPTSDPQLFQVPHVCNYIPFLERQRGSNGAKQ